MSDGPDMEAEFDDVVDLSDEDVVDLSDDIDGDVDLDSGGDEDVLLLAEVDEELVLPVWEPTGEAQVDEALELLTTLDVDDVHQHAAVYGEIHEKLRATLSNADTPTG